MTITACPHGCGGYVNTGADSSCSGCQLPPNITQFPVLGTCWNWSGPDDRRTRCRQTAGHEGPHDDRGDLK